MRGNLDGAIDWEVMQTAVFNPYGREIKGFKALVNGGSGETLQIVSDSYQPVKNAQLVECAQTVSERTGLIYEYEGKKYLKFQVSERKEVDQFGHTHSVSHFTPKAKLEPVAKPKRRGKK